MVVHLRFFALAIFTATLYVASAQGALSAQKVGNAADKCASNGQTSYPRAALSNGAVNAVVYLPDAKDGYYRGSRFDWSGVVGCLAYKGHTYFGVWFPQYDPLLHDAISGPVEEFRSSDGEGAMKYDEAKPGDPFVKLGVGVLRRTDDAPFKFSATYPLIDGGKWTVHTGRTAITFRQVLKSPVGIAYDYKKTLKLDKQAPILSIEHAMKNTGAETIESLVYNHDFYVLDGAPTGPDMAVHFPFAAKAEKNFGNGGRILGNDIMFNRELQTGESVFGRITGYSASPSDFDFVVENRKTGVGVEETADKPLARIVFWSIRTTICPEGYVHIKIAPGETAHWTIRYRFYAK